MRTFPNMDRPLPESLFGPLIWEGDAVNLLGRVRLLADDIDKEGEGRMERGAAVIRHVKSVLKGVQVIHHQSRWFSRGWKITEKFSERAGGGYFSFHSHPFHRARRVIWENDR